MTGRLAKFVSGLSDGTTIALALVAGMSAVIRTPANIFLASLAVMTSWAILLGTGSFLTGKKEQVASPLRGAVAMGAGYFAGGMMVTVPFCIIPETRNAMWCAGIVASCILFVAGYADSRIHQANGWAGGIRATVTALAAAALAFGVASLFR